MPWEKKSIFNGKSLIVQRSLMMHSLFAGNICRSPIAEAVFLRLLKERGVQDDVSV